MTTRSSENALLRDIQWRDLVPLTIFARVFELTLSAPWLIASLALYARGGRWLLPGAVCTFFFFLTGLRQSHNAQHYCLGIGRLAQDIVLLVLSVLMMMSMHAVQVTHMIHHRHCLEEGDVEAGHAAKPWWLVLLTGPLFPFKLIAEAMRRATPGKRRWIIAELVLMAAWIAVALYLNIAALRWHLAAVITGECFTAFFAVWTVHHGCEPGHQMARTQRGWLKNFVSYSMFFHLEHHLFPAVPTSHLPALARRLDAAMPGLSSRQVF